jgi:ribose transport system substrate-binding protein
MLREQGECVLPYLDKVQSIRPALGSHSALGFLSFSLLLLSACSSHHREIALLTPTTGNPIWDAVHTGAVVEAHGCGLKVHYDAPPRSDDLRAQLELFKQFSDAGYGAIIIAPIQERALRDPIRRAAAAGIPIIVVGTDLRIQDPNLTYILNDEEAGGRLAADKIGEIINGKGNVAVMGTDLTSPSMLQRERAFEQELSIRYPKVRVVQRERGSKNLFEEQQSAEQLLLDHSDTIDAVVALSSFATRGALNALDTGHWKHRIRLIGFDQDLMLPLQDGRLDAVIAVKSNDIGRLGSQLACEHLEGKTWERGHSVTPFLITSSNINSAEVVTQIYDSQWWEFADENK